GVGKSSLSTRFTYGHFDKFKRTLYYPHWKQCLVDNEFAFLDVNIAGCEGYAAERKYTSGEGFLLVYSVRSRSSFEMIRNLHQRILWVKLGKPVPIVLVGNKCDFEYQLRAVSMDEGYDLANQLGCPFIETSAKERTNVDEAYYNLVREIR
ncbi:small GTPase superfamily, partial [Cyathus striatus]